MGSTVKVKVKDVTGQIEREVSIPGDALVNQTVESFREALNLPAIDVDGRPVNYKLRNDTKGQREIPGQSLVSEEIEEQDTITVKPDIIAG